MSGLVDFLLARIAEDERTVRYGTVNARHPALQLDSDGYPVMDLRRVVAECAAKRRIIELADEATGLDAQVDNEYRVGSRDMAKEPYIGDLILMALAAPYSDHADFDASWTVGGGLGG